MATDREQLLTQKAQTLAQNIMFGKVTEADLPSYGLEYRKGKTFADLKKAAQRGLKQGMGKTEFELSMIEVQIKTVLKLI